MSFIFEENQIHNCFWSLNATMSHPSSGMPFELIDRHSSQIWDQHIGFIAGH